MKDRTRLKKKAWLGVMLLLLISMLVSACSGNSGNGNQEESASPPAAETTEPSANASPEGIDTSEPVTLKMVLLGSKPTDTDDVYAEVNKILKEKINATIELRYLDWNEYNQKYPLLFAANEDFDLIFASSWAFYQPTARKDGFLELTEDMLKTYAPATWAQQDPLGWEQAKVDGKIYMVPSDYFESGHGMVILRGDLREKYNLPEVKSQADFVKFLSTVAKNEKGMTAFGGPSTSLNGVALPIMFNDLERVFVHGSAPLVYDMKSEHPKLYNYLDDSKYIEKLNTLYDMAQQGIWPKDAIVSKTDWAAAFKEGKTAAHHGNLLTLAATMEAITLAHPEWKPEVIDLVPDAKRIRAPFHSNGIGIHATSKHPERALMALDLLRHDKELFDLTTYGIKGKHWEPVGDGKYRSLPGSTGYPPDGACPWGWRTQGMYRQLEGAAGDLLASTYDKWKKNNIVDLKLATFVLDDANIKNELAALANVQKTYLLPIYHGLVKPEDGIPEVQEKLKQAGIDKVQAEMQKQIDAFVQSNP
ncbi:ABC transporter substrate-binding protein [Paenibacillus methanolicus]|uniref:Putative aldouronate transport system substrate-binding protein n=1 Tax=Paenibacillus methanolicus TaxID=582686 RepID=A0A5S5CF60_9BACL|nr:ABC transporter substrate-binding protein [Paenibacillus methanolicus]TYP76633.1 putative aldouronate transport system substrate-binding protein [Paenibacillus methanolicus]